MDFIGELRNMPLQSEEDAQKMLGELKDFIRGKVRAGATGEISGSPLLRGICQGLYLGLSGPDCCKHEKERRPISLLHKNWFIVHYEYSIDQRVLDAIPKLKEYAKAERIWVSDPYVVVKDSSRAVKANKRVNNVDIKHLQLRDGHVKFDSLGFRGLDGMEYYVSCDAHIDCKITI